MTDERRSSKELDWQALLDQALEVPGQISATYTRFYQYSWLNCLLLQLQGVEGPVNTYERWKAMGRQVVKGAKAAEIVRPITIVKKDDDGEVEATFTRFKFVKCIFGYSQTEGEELPPVETPGWDLDTALTRLDIAKQPYTQLNGNIAGHSWGRNIAISPVDPEPLATTAHEIGHILLGHTEPDRLAEYQKHRGIMEFEAEATSYLAMHELGAITEQQASESRAYIQNWLQDQRPSNPSIRAVFSATDRLIRAGRPQTD